MINKDITYTIFHDDNSSFTDYSDNMGDFSRDTATITLNKDEDYIYVGFKKPFNSLYVELDTANTSANTFAVQYYSTEWSSLTVVDESKGFTRNGFIRFTKPTDWASTEINSTSKFWIRLRPSATHSETVISGIGLVFSDDIDLANEQSDISYYLGSSRSSFIMSHVSSRDRIIQLFRNKGLLINDEVQGTYFDLLSSMSEGKIKLSATDLHDIDEVRLASIYLALYNIYFNAEDKGGDGNLMYKAKDYETKALSLIDGILLSFDKNNDGQVNEPEKFNSVRSARLHR